MLNDEHRSLTKYSVFPCIASLAILDRLDVVDQDMLGWWLAERQLPNGGLNGRPEKLEDVCYSFWVLSSLSILNRVSWIDAEKLTTFILSAQVSRHRSISLGNCGTSTLLGSRTWRHRG